MKNKLTDNDPRLTAYALGELPREEAEKISDILAAGQNIALKKEVESIDSLSVMLSQTLGFSVMEVGGAEPQIKLSARQRDAIFRSAKAPTVNDVSSANQSRWLRPVLVTLGAAALVTFSFMLLDNVDSNEPSVAQLPGVSFSELSENELHAPILPSREAWDVSSRGNATSGSNQVSEANQLLISSDVAMDDSKSSLSNLIKLVENDWVNRAESSTIRMPMVCGKASWNWVSQSILKNTELPNENVVRVEEIINAFKYEISTDLDLKHASTGVDLVRCPWNNDNLIAIIVVENKHQDNIQIEAAVSFTNTVNKYRVIGYSKSENQDENLIAPDKVTMAKDASHIVMYEIVPEQVIENAADVLSIDIRTTAMSPDKILEQDSKTLDMQFSERDWRKASQDMQFALIMVSWSQVISGSEYDNTMDYLSIQEMLTSFEGDFTPNEEQLKAINVLKKSIDLIR